MKLLEILLVVSIFFSCFFLSVTFADTSNININQIDTEIEPYVHVSSQTYIDTYFSWYFAKINNYTTYAQFKINPDFLADTKNITAISTSNQVTTYCNKWLNLTNGSLALSNCDATSVTTLKSNVLNLTTVKNYPLINLTTNIGFSNFIYNASSGIGEFYISFPKGITGNESAKLGFGTVLVDSTATSGGFPCIALDSNGYVYIAHTANSGTVVRQCNNTLGWSCSQIDANGSLGNGIGCAMDNQNVFHIMYRDGGNNTWRYWNNSAVQIRYAMILGYTPAYASLAIDSLNNKHFVFDNYTGARQAVYCNATAVTNTFSTCSKPDSTGNAGEYINVAVNSTNKAQVVFKRASTGILRYCNIISGSTWTCISLKTGTGYGTYPTISVKQDQSIVIVSVNITGTDSMRLWNNSVNARNTWKEYILAYGASVQYTSVAVDYANNTHVIWFNATNTMAYLNVTNGFTVTATARYTATDLGGQCMGSCLAIKKGNEGNFANSYDNTAHFAYRNSTLNYDNKTGLPQPSIAGTNYRWNATDTNLSIIDSIIINTILKRTVIDTLTITDSISTRKTLNRNTNDILTLLDSIIIKKSVIKSLSDSLSLIDNIQTTQIRTRTVTDTLTITDSISTRKTLNRNTNDILTLLDSIIIKKSVIKSLSDSLSLIDNIQTTQIRTRTVTDTLTIIDSISTNKTLNRNAADSLSIIDSVFSSKGFARNSFDSILIIDSISIKKTIKLTYTESITITDSITKRSTFTRNLSDVISFTERINYTYYVQPKQYNMSVNDTISLISNIKLSVTKRTTEVITITDYIEKRMSTNKLIQDTITIIDSIRGYLSYSRTKFDTLSITDMVTRKLTATQVYSDNINLQDYISRKLSTSKLFIDVFNIISNPTKLYSAIPLIRDTISIIDSISRKFTGKQLITDTLTIYDRIYIRITVTHQEVNVSDIIRLTTRIYKTTNGTLTLNLVSFNTSSFGVVITYGNNSFNYSANSWYTFEWNYTGGLNPIFNLTLIDTLTGNVTNSTTTTSNTITIYGLNDYTNYTAILSVTDYFGTNQNQTLTSMTMGNWLDYPTLTTLGLMIMIILLSIKHRRLIRKPQGSH
jgi:hypothetical protein